MASAALQAAFKAGIKYGKPLLKAAAKNGKTLIKNGFKNGKTLIKNGKNGHNGVNGLRNGLKIKLRRGTPTVRSSVRAEKAGKIKQSGPLSDRPNLRSLRFGETIPRSAKQARHRGINRSYHVPQNSPKGTKPRPHHIRTRRKGTDQWKIKSEGMPQWSKNKGASIRNERIARQTSPTAPPRTDVAAKGQHAHHIAELAATDPLFLQLPRYKQKALIRFLEKRGIFTGDHPKNIKVLQDTLHDLIHRWRVDQDLQTGLTVLGEAPISVRMNQIRKFMIDQRKMMEQLERVT